MQGRSLLGEYFKNGTLIPRVKLCHTHSQITWRLAEDLWDLKSYLDLNVRENGSEKSQIIRIDLIKKF